MKWFTRRRHIPFLIVGHPRCGTTSAATICRQINFDVGDEYVGVHGISSWMMAVDDRLNPYSSDQLGRSRRNLAWDWLMMVVRDLKDAVPSVMIENKYAPASYAFRRKHIRRQIGFDLDGARDETTAAVRSIVYWSRIISRQRPDFWFRIEDQQQKLRDFILATQSAAETAAHQSLPDERANAEKLYDAVKYTKPDISPEDWRQLEPDVKDEIAQYCEDYGYANPVR